MIHGINSIINGVLFALITKCMSVVRYSIAVDYLYQSSDPNTLPMFYVMWEGPRSCSLEFQVPMLIHLQTLLDYLEHALSNNLAVPIFQ